MAATLYGRTPVSNYGLGRNSVLELVFSEIGGTGTQLSAIFAICISAGSVSLDVDTIEIASNCQSGWKIKLPGLISGTVTATGYIASSAVKKTDGKTMPSTDKDPMNILQYLGKTCEVGLMVDTPKNELSNPDTSMPLSDQPFFLLGTSDNPRNGFFKSASISISPDDAVKIDFTLELSGASDLRGYAAVAAAETGVALDAALRATMTANGTTLYTLPKTAPVGP